MIEDIKLIAMLLGVAIMSAIVRYKTFVHAISDTVLGFVTGYVGYLVLSYFDISNECRSGVSGVLIMYARPLYDFINMAISTKLGEWMDYRIKK